YDRYILLANRGVSRYLHRHWDDALADLEQAAKLNPKLYQAHNNLADMYFERKDYEKALAALDKAIALKPAVLPALYRERAKINRTRREFEAALADTDAAMKADTIGPESSLQPGSPEAERRARDLQWRGTTLLALKKYDEAVTTCDRALTLKPDLAAV